MFPPFSLLNQKDRCLTVGYLGSLLREPDLTIAPDGEPYLYRWYIAKNQEFANVYFHMQVKDDPERPLHDHPWDNMSVILSNGYREIIQREPPKGTTDIFLRKAGQTIMRKAEHAHRLLISPGQPYTLTIFATGPRVRRWGFWYPQGWVDFEKVCELRPGGISVHTDNMKGDMS